VSATDIPALEARSLGKQFLLPRGWLFGPPRLVTAVENVSFSVPAGKTLGIVGESGSGKTTVAKMLLKLEAPTAGSLLYDGADIFAQTKDHERNYRRQVQAVLQDPYGALSPRLSIGMIIAEPMLALGGASRREALDNARRMLELVGLRPEAADRHPHQFSGGQRQRVAIARALSVNPKVLILDEPVSALDVSVRAQILQLLRQMQERFEMTYVFIGHDLATVRYMSDFVGVMYFGRLVEAGSARALFQRPLHPYTRKLVALSASRARVTRSDFRGELPDPLNPPSGCSFHTRCAYASARCRDELPKLRNHGSGHQVSCHHTEEIDITATAGTG
jgi:oligopeptide/dipeptide ABC transporter ATP-binding protein